jgi:RNA methyltransferase, TrmH family
LTHQRVRRLRRLVQKRSLRWSEGVCVLEGPDLVLSALASRAEFEAIYLDQGYVDSEEARRIAELARASSARVFQLAPGVLERVADATTPQPVLASIRMPVSSLDAIDIEGLVLVLHDVRDPGNAGTLVRSADAAGVMGVVFTGHSVDPFNPKTLRATAGSIFRVPVAVSELDEALSAFEGRGAVTLATVVRGGVDHRRVDFTKPTVVVIGNEAEGLDDESIRRCGGAITIEMSGRSESLNAGVAGSLVAFESMWQRRSTDATLPPPSL